MFDHHTVELLNSLGDACVVGGSVRDRLLGDEAKDLDIEVYGVDFATLEEIASRFGKTNAVGKSFGILKLSHLTLGEVDLSLPRRESKVGIGHRGFAVEPDPTMTAREAAARRDFTINALAWSPREGLVDHFGGVDDLHHGILRHTSPAFAEDPLRVLRGFQFAGRMRLALTPETAALCASLTAEFSTLAVERIWEEWRKWALKSVRPSDGLRCLREAGWLGLFPELSALTGVRQDPGWHPEGDVWIHTGHVCDAAAAIARRDRLDDDDRLVLMFAALCHDLAKPDHTQHEDGRIRSRGHEKAGDVPTRSFLAAIGAPAWLIASVVPLVINHLAHCQGLETDRAVRRLATRLRPVSILALSRLVEADQSGRPPLDPGMPDGMQRIVERAQALQLEHQPPAPILMGRHLIKLGLTPGPDFGRLLDAAFEAQLDGVFGDLEGALAFIEQRGPMVDPGAD